MGQTVMGSLALRPMLKPTIFYISYQLYRHATGYTHELVIRALPSSSFCQRARHRDTGSTPLATVTNLAAGKGAYATDGATDYAGDVDYIRFWRSSGRK